jgi:hypothetical protein
MAALEVGSVAAADTRAKPGGTARKRREQRKRADGRHVAWLISLQQARASHHTAPARASGAVEGTLAARISSLEEAVASLLEGKQMGQEVRGMAHVSAALVGEGTFEDDGPNLGVDARSDVVAKEVEAMSDEVDLYDVGRARRATLVLDLKGIGQQKEAHVRVFGEKRDELVGFLTDRMQAIDGLLRMENHLLASCEWPPTWKAVPMGG